jgi:hypothetical protein
VKLSFNYKSGSTLARRVFVINVQQPVSFLPDEDEMTFEVTAPDQIFAQEIVRRHLDGDASVLTFWIYSIREVVYQYRTGSIFIRPFMLEGKSVRFPYINGSI